MTLHAEAAGFTHRGIRERNEDCIAIGYWNSQESMDLARGFDEALDLPFVAIVADGMGGHNDGDQASKFVAHGLARRLPAFGPEDIGKSLRAVNAELYGHVREHPELAGMGSTVVGLAIHDKTVSVFSVGDSRCYRLEGKALKQLSRDDSTQPNWKFGQPRSTLLLQCFGGRETFTDIEPFVHREPVQPGAVYLVCCDGLYETLPEDKMASLIGPDLQASCEALFKEAMAQKARDNVTIALVRIVDK